ncbi:MAG TPA: DUF6036 family nucleotidyltransferase [Phycisphaerales bacterium]|nr:DUF6036 family nucleotidyltransferase [Phycisphaerales bacterium]
MNRQQLEHILRAAAAITGAEELVVIGSQAILGAYPDAPAELLHSFEVDVYSRRSNEDADLIDGSIGEGSPFHQTFGYYAHGVAEETAVLPAGWKDRLVPLRGPGTGGATGLCLEPHDLAISKLVAGREKDLSYVAAMVRHRLVDPTVLQARLDLTTLDDALRAACAARLRRAVSLP